MPYTCRICGEKSTEKYIAREVKQGTGEEFVYFKCPSCGCLQIAEIPADIAKYYENYYSITKRGASESALKSLLRKQLFQAIIRKRFFHRIFSNINNGFEWMNQARISFTSKIIDVGCGSGRLLIKMANSGFCHLQGIDPYIDTPLTYRCRRCSLSILKGGIESLSEQYDFIMLHHVLEHIDNQSEVFRTLKRLLAPDGQILINIPIVDSAIWDIYKTDCFQLEDAPRHLYLHTQKSIRLLADAHNLKIEQIHFVASPMIFTASEKQRQRKSGKSSSFSPFQYLKFQREAKYLAKNGQSGLACFYLTHK